MRALLGIALLAASCGSKDTAIAELVQAEAPVEKQSAVEPGWAAAAVGTEFFLGDAAKTGVGGAQLSITNSAQIAMQPNTVLRFGGKPGENKIGVEVGAIDLTGTGRYGLDIGDVKLSNRGSVRITANDIKLTVGDAQVQTAGGQTIDLKVDTAIELGAAVARPLVDAGVPDAAVVDASVPEVVASEATVEVTGKRAELQLAGGKWTPLAAGTADLPKGAKLRTGGNTTAKLVARGTTLELGGASRAAVGDDFTFAIEAGTGKIATSGDGAVGLPGGSVAMRGSDQAPAEARIDPAAGGTKVTVQRGGAKLVGSVGSLLEMSRGESATLLRNGTIRPLEAIPGYFDLRVVTGGSFTIHDARPPTAVQFQFAGKCPAGGIIEVDRDARFRTAKVSGGKESANHALKAGGWYYRLRCTAGANEGGAVASGRISVVGDAGSRPLPPPPARNPFSPDGRPWTFSYQSQIPDLAVTFPGSGSSFRLHLARGGKDLTFESSGPALRVAGSALSEGAYTYWFDRDDVKQDTVNTLKIDFDQTTPQVYIVLPVSGKPWEGDVDVKGAVLPGWAAAVEGVAVPIDARTRRFNAKVGAPQGKALAIRLSHPQRGVHYYLRRAK
ncbi:MAG: hypothetical protein ABI867_42020 [Kofleriaceae bacterium]